MKNGFLAFVVLFIASTMLSGCRNAVSDNIENEMIAQPIILALDQYSQLNGQYPLEIQHLVPEYLTALPKTVRGEDFEYFPDKLEGYYLCFGIGTRGKYGCCYYCRLTSWDCTEGD